MDPNKLTKMASQAITDAQAIARRLNHNEVETWHLLSALLGQENGIVPGLIDKMGLSASALQLAVDRELERLPAIGRDERQPLEVQMMDRLGIEAQPHAALAAEASSGACVSTSSASSIS